jgi:TRAP transporter 4TM/12TM fusion protein
MPPLSEPSVADVARQLPTAVLEQPAGDKFRPLAGPWRHLTRGVFVSIPIIGLLFVFDTPSYLGLAPWKEQYLGLFLALVLGMVFLIAPARRGGPVGVPWYDAGLAATGFGVCFYLAAFYPELAFAQRPGWTEIIFGTLALALVLEATRRLTGWALVVLALGFIGYGCFAYLLPGFLYGKGISWHDLFAYLYVDNNALLGITLYVTATTVLGMFLFGNVLYAAGGGDFLVKFSLASMGRFRGGPAKMAVVSSSLFGTISGSAVANVTFDGLVTIPLMKRSGYRPHVAGAIEAAASTGGQIMPPVMGVAAFIMANFLGIPYAQVALAALLPAVMYYLALFVQIDLEAVKYRIRGVASEEKESLLKLLRRSHVFLVPLAVLIYTLFVLNLAPEKAAVAAVLAVMLLGLLDRGIGTALVKNAATILEDTGRQLLELGVIAAVAGVVVGVLARTGLGVSFALTLLKLSGENVLLLLLVAAGASMLLGMGMPTPVVYILLAALIGSGLTQAGLLPLAAHLFILYFASLSMVTPPVCLAAYAGAMIAGASPMRTGWESCRILAGAYLVPFIFVLNPALLLNGSLSQIVEATLLTAAIMVLVSVSLTGHLHRRLLWLERVSAMLGGLGLTVAVTMSGGDPLAWGGYAIGAAMTLYFVFSLVLQARRKRALGASMVTSGDVSGDQR